MIRASKTKCRVSNTERVIENRRHSDQGPAPVMMGHQDLSATSDCPSSRNDRCLFAYLFERGHTRTHTSEFRPMQKGKAQARPVTSSSAQPWTTATARPTQVCHCLSRPDLSAYVCGCECWWMFPELLLCVHQKLECVTATSESELGAFEICWQLQRVVCSSAKPDQRGSDLTGSIQNTCCAKRDGLCSVDCMPIPVLRFGWKQNVLKILLLGGTWKLMRTT